MVALLFSRLQELFASLRKYKFLYYKLLLTFLMVIVGVVVVAGAFFWKMRDTVMPGVMVAGIDMSWENREDAIIRLNKVISMYRQSLPDRLIYDGKTWKIDWSESKLYFLEEETIDNALRVGREGMWWQHPVSSWLVWRQGREVDLLYQYDLGWFEGLADAVIEEVDIPVIQPSIKYVSAVGEQQATLEFVEGEIGLSADMVKWQSGVEKAISRLETIPQDLPVKTVELSVTVTQVDKALERANNLLRKRLILEYENGSDNRFILDEEALVSFVSIKKGYSRELVDDYLEGVAESINRDPVNALFEFDEDKQRVVAFSQALEGIRLDIPVTSERLIRALSLLEQADDVEPVLLSVQHTKPEITLASINDLGVVELLGRGESTYRGSIPSRAHNIALAAQKIHGTLVKPDEEFSYNKALGEISQRTGFKQAYIISDGRTILGDGGGVCQDSTTVFRAALDAGLSITERRAHSYRVGYYEQDAKPGLDASVYAPYSDFKFLNDTPAHILVQARADNTRMHLTVELYGTSDGREAEIVNHTVWDVTPPPPDVWVDDTSLAPGQVKQVDWQAWGAKAKFDYVVRRDGEVILEKTFSSTFRPWAAVYLRGV